MQSFFSKLSFAGLAVTAMTALFLSSLFLGFKSGAAQAQAKKVYATVQNLSKGLDNFFSDQDRFPTAQELQDTNILLTYFTALPDNLSGNSACSENFMYKRLNPYSYRLDFCLAADINSNRKGWNQVTVQK